MLQGILIGIKGILDEGLKSAEVPVLKAHMSSAKSMLEGIIKEYEKNPDKLDIVPIPADPVFTELDPSAEEARKELR